MKTFLQILCLSFIWMLDGCPGLPDFDLLKVGKGDTELRDGDIIFHTSRSSQSLLIQKATGSPWSHMGVVFHMDGKPMVYEAVGPVKSTPLNTWTKRGKDGHYVVKRLKDADRLLTSKNLEKLRKAGLAYRGKPYDLRFRFSDEELYCSELVYKIYRNALGIEVGELQRFSDFDLSVPEVRSELKRRYKGGFNPSETLITPEAMYRSPLLETVAKR
jgi:uncharacterized protein YycO